MGAQATREQIVEAADRLFYERGFEHTSFAEIAQAVGISRGNFYYHFKAKDAILSAVVMQRLARTQAMLGQWEREAAGPAERIMRFIEILIVNQSKIMRHGCPVGSLCTELAKLDHPARPEANRILGLFRDWLARQFDQLGRPDADDLALHVLARSQGIATLATAFEDAGFVRREVARVGEWLQAEITGAAPPAAAS